MTFNEASTEQVASDFVDLILKLLRKDRRNGAPLKNGLKKLGVKLNSEAPKLEEGKPAGGVGVADMREAMSPLSDEQITTFIFAVGTLMFSSEDGPMACAVSLTEVIVHAEEKVEAEKSG